MKALRRIAGLFSFKAPERVEEALVTAMEQNTTLIEIGPANWGTEHLWNNDTVQFYLELNRLGRAPYISSYEKVKGSGGPPVELLSHFFARMAVHHEETSHLHYFLRRATPKILEGNNEASSSPHKRKVKAASVKE